ncbi:hypothetical protein [Sphingomonas crusticola]|uniref:hypothetical protein n=1 Tax=Sphingomonas crusticola TaxID=1697973 RepID=UPI0013C2AE27|nr:hypothetical protein [Sphingomonas crusticola]
MVFLALALAAMPVPSQVLDGASFDRFARQADRACPARQLRLITPASLDWEEEGFEEQLSPQHIRSLSAANQQEAHCAGRDGLACPTVETLKAMIHTRLLRPFVVFACSHRQP